MNFSPLTNFAARVYLPLGRISIFVIYFWFGLLKVLGLSPANPLVGELLKRTLPFISFGDFIFLFGLFEMAIGLIFIFPKFDKISIWVFFAHFLTTTLALFVLRITTWHAPFVPTLEGQYIIKNVALLTVVFAIIARFNSRSRVRN